MVCNALAVDPEVRGAPSDAAVLDVLKLAFAAWLSAAAAQLAAFPACCSPATRRSSYQARFASTATAASPTHALAAALSATAAAARGGEPRAAGGRLRPGHGLCGGGHAHATGSGGHLLRPAGPGHAHAGSVWAPRHGGGSGSRGGGAAGGGSGGSRGAMTALRDPSSSTITCNLLPHASCLPPLLTLFVLLLLQVLVPFSGPLLPYTAPLQTQRASVSST